VTIAEHTDNDSYWGHGGECTAKNMLGRILMEVRDELRRQWVTRGRLGKLSTF